MKITESGLHLHIRARMLQRGITLDEIQRTLSEGRDAEDAADGTFGRVLVFPFNTEWEGKYFEEKEVTVYYKYKEDEFILLTAKARYGRRFGGGSR